MLINKKSSTNGKLCQEWELNQAVQGEFSPVEENVRECNQTLVPIVEQEINEAEQLQEDRPEMDQVEVEE